MKRVEDIVKGLRSCNSKCRKCIWRDGFSGECLLNDCAANYIEALEADNANEITYCKDCIYCEKKMPTYNWQNVEYLCKNRDGLPIVPSISPMDYCSRAMRKTEGDKHE